MKPGSWDLADEPERTPVFARRGEPRVVAGAAEVVTEDGRTISLQEGRLPVRLPLGYHRLVWRDDETPARLVVSPGACHLPAGLKTWGWAVQLYALRSRRSWGIGDLLDLERLMAWSERLGAGMTMINPLHAVHGGAGQQASPYFPSSRCWRNPLYVSVDDVPGAAEAAAELEGLRASATRLNEDRRIDRDSVYRLKLEALELLWSRRRGDDGFAGFARAHGAALESFCTFVALTEHLGPNLGRWPSEYRHPSAPAVARFRTDNTERIRFHAWLQWLLHRQLARAASHGGLIQDLAVGVDPSGADAWLWQEVFAPGVHVGAPPDAFNSQGQNWGVLVFDPWRLRRAEYEPFIQCLRSSLATGGGLRIDHVMGLWRLFWIPEGASPAEGTYVRYPAEDLLDIVALESHRAGAYVVGEDLGTVPAGVRAEMGARDMLSYRLLWFEPGPPSTYPAKALAAVTNHDLPTIAGMWSGADLRTLRGMGLEPDLGAHEAASRQLLGLPGVRPGSESREVVMAAYRALATAPCALLAATLEDALGVTERPNYPGTTHEWPNWSLALPELLEDIESDPVAGAIAALLGRAEQGP